jgi:hypothetical protein
VWVLAATYQQVKSSGADLTQLTEITAEIEQLLAGERSWRNAYHIEQLMVPLYTGDKLDIELRRRLLEAEKIQPPISEGDIEDLKTSRGWTFILSRAFVGIGASLILYYLITAGVVGGDIFPKIDGLFTAQAVDPNFRKQFALLIVACFLAGFSERLVPNLLSRSEQDLEARQAPPPRPTTTG